MYRFGQTDYVDSRFGFFSRRKLEKQILYADGSRPFFVEAYKIYVDALAQRDMATLKKMSEKKLLRTIQDDYKFIDEQNFAIK